MSEICKSFWRLKQVRLFVATIEGIRDERSRVNQSYRGCFTHDMDKRSIAELTVSELEELIKRTVKDSVSEVMIEFALEADVEAKINDMLRGELQSYGSLLPNTPVTRHNVDD